MNPAHTPRQLDDPPDRRIVRLPFQARDAILDDLDVTVEKSLGIGYQVQVDA